MAAGSAGLQRWTRRFALASAVSLLASVAASGTAAPGRGATVLGLFGFVCGMVFGMAYLLLPAYVGRTLVDQRLAGVHLALAYVGVALLVAGELPAGAAPIVPTATSVDPFALGALAWSLGVAVFVGALLATVVPALLADPEVVLRSPDRPQRSTRLATATVPVAVAYLVAGTVALLGTAGLLPGLQLPFPRVVHLYGAGFAALLVFAIGARLLIGFFHVEAPRPATWLVLGAGATAPALIGTRLWVAPWFHVGAALEAVAMAGYAAIVCLVALRTDRRGPGMLGVLLGALLGLAGVAVAASVPLAGAPPAVLHAHAALVLAGFFPLTIAGYAVEFFPAADGGIRGIGRRAAATTLVLLAVGAVLRAAAALGAPGALDPVGTTCSLAGAGGYVALLGHRFLG